MVQRTYRHRKHRRKTFKLGQSVSFGFFVIFGFGLVYGGVNWFRYSADSKVALEELDVATQSLAASLVPEEVSAAENLSGQASLISAFDGQSTGLVNRTYSEDGWSYSVLAYLPGLDRSAERYGVWLLKTGLADVKAMGELTPRADGSWSLDFTANLLTGIVNGADYSNLVIMKEQRGDSGVPGGVRMAEAVF